YARGTCEGDLRDRTVGGNSLRHHAGGRSAGAVLLRVRPPNGVTQCCACLSSAAGRTLTSLRPISRCNSAGIKPANLIVGTASSFGLSQSTRQRYYNVIGLAHSADATVFADLVELAYLLSAVRGRREFAPTIPLRFTNSYSPHDEELTK